MEELNTALRDDFHFLRVNGKTYTLTETTLNTVNDVVSTIKYTMENRANIVLASLTEARLAECREVSNTEHRRIIEEVAQTGHSIPEGNEGTPMVVIGAHLCPVRCAILHPNKVVCSVNGIRGVARETLARLSDLTGVDLDARYFAYEADQDLRIAHRITINMKPPNKFAFSCMFAMSPDGIMMSRKSFHTFSANRCNPSTLKPWYKLCIGNTPIEAFFTANDFDANINTLNPDSFAINTHCGLTTFPAYLVESELVSASICTDEWRV